MKITNAIIWDRRHRATAGGEGQLEIRVTFERKSHYIGTGIKVRKNEFMAGQIINRPDAKELNERLIIIYKKVLACVNACMETGETFTTESINRSVWSLIEANDGPVFLNWIDAQIPKLDLKDSTRKRYRFLLNRLTEYGKMTQWSDVTVEGIMDFDAWLRSLKSTAKDGEATAKGRLGDGLSDGAVYNYHKCLKALIRRAHSFDRISDNPYDKLYGKIKRGDRENVEYLTEDEMQAIENLELPLGSKMDQCRDLFVFQMWTGLAYSDAEAFDISLYKKVGNKWINTGERIKTGVPYISQLLPPVVKVLQKYDWHVPQIDNAQYNRTLKYIGMAAGIYTPLHSHLARHSFATYMLSQGTRIENVGKMLGQTNIRTTQRYAKVLAKDVHDDFDKIEKKLKKRKS
jgi:integrase